MAQPKIIVEFEDKYGERRVVHRDKRGRMMLKRIKRSVSLVLNPVVARMVGSKIRAARRAKDMGPTELLYRAGLVAAVGCEKHRIYEIEKAGGRRGQGVRLGTLFALANALGVEAKDLLPTNAEVLGVADVSMQPPPITEILGIDGDVYEALDPNANRLDRDAEAA